MVNQYKNLNVTSHTYKGTTVLKGSKKFNSGNSSIDAFAKSNLRAHAKAPGNAVTVLLDNDHDKNLIGYVTIVAHTLSKSELEKSSFNIGKTPAIPVVKLNMLGVSSDYQKKGFGLELMRLALNNTKQVCELIGCAGLYLEAAPDAIKFYSGLGFESLSPPNKTSGIMPMFLHVDMIP